ncbi:uncharacterized protein LOC110931853 [Helianthus annuus]|uniref:uncharacterized protein LOC110931853 n=1 Tax=Helianthus annuus TaxID=4232 RepID=UPI000B8EFF97|nr:uncharacterized protein LOC110931853 [Helianthus annuus]
MFLVNNLYALILFDTGADKSFVSVEFESLINCTRSKLPESFSVEVANGKSILVNSIVRDCSLTLNNHMFSIDLIPMRLGSFDVIIGMDWLRKNHAEVVCLEKLVRLPIPSGDTLIVYGDRPSKGLRLMSCTQASRSLRKQNPAFLAHVVEQKGKRKNISDVPVVYDFTDVFPEDYPGLPPLRSVDFRINLVPGATPVARAPYRLAPSEMQELSSQLQELLDKGFIRLSTSLWGAPVLFVKKKDVFIDGIFIYSKSKADDARHLRLMLELLRGERLYAKFSKCEFWIDEVKFQGHIVSSQGIHVDLSKIEALKNWCTPKSVSEIRSFLGLAGYYRRFIADFSKIAVPLTTLTQKEKPFVWGPEQENSFQTLKNLLCNAPVLALPDGNNDFVANRLLWNAWETS